MGTGSLYAVTVKGAALGQIELRSQSSLPLPLRALGEVMGTKSIPSL